MMKKKGWEHKTGMCITPNVWFSTRVDCSQKLKVKSECCTSAATTIIVVDVNCFDAERGRF